MCFSYLGLRSGVGRAYGRRRLGCRGLRHRQKSSFAIYMEGSKQEKSTEQVLERKLFKKVASITDFVGAFLRYLFGPRPLVFEHCCWTKTPV